MSRRWTPEQIRIISERYASDGAVAVAKLIGRSVVAVQVFAVRAGLSRAPRIDSSALADLNPLFAAYLAGVLDGEGSIQINPTQGARLRFWNLSIQIASSMPGFLDSLRTQTHQIGTITSSQPRGKGKCRRAYSWRIYADAATWFLRQILPFLVIKREHALVALEFRTLVGGSNGRRGMSDEMSHARGRLAYRMRELNAKTGKAKAGPFDAAVR
jgi:hypothetical protein